MVEDVSVVVNLGIIILSIIIGTLAAIIYSLRILVLLEKRIARMDENVERISLRILKEERIIERKLSIRKRKKRRK